jgi:hypothetical protein
MHAIALGFGPGFVVAAAIGPIWLLGIRTVPRGALGTRVAIGAGAARSSTPATRCSGRSASPRSAIGSPTGC